MDSMNGGGTMSNFQGTMNSLNAELASMQQSYSSQSFTGYGGYDDPMANLARETQMINEAAEDIARTMMGEEVDISSRSYYAGEPGTVPSLDALMSSVGSGGAIPGSAATGYPQPSGLPASSAPAGSAIGFDPAMRPGGATAYDAVGNSSGIQGTSTPGSSVPSRDDTIINETYSFTCPSGTQGNVPIIADSQVCAAAMKRFAKVYSCNLFEEFESAQLEMNRVCASNMFE